MTVEDERPERDFVNRRGIERAAASTGPAWELYLCSIGPRAARSVAIARARISSPTVSRWMGWVGIHTTYLFEGSITLRAVVRVLDG